jgi:uncharacterized DUF497 family protein
MNENNDKEQTNISEAHVRKSQLEAKVSFRRVASVFRDPNQLSVFDEEHSESEDRWITIDSLS